jgi:hypothetical protein
LVVISTKCGGTVLQRRSNSCHSLTQRIQRSLAKQHPQEVRQMRELLPKFVITLYGEGYISRCFTLHSILHRLVTSSVFVGLEVSMLASGTKDRGFAPGRSRQKNHQYAFLRKGSKTVCPMSQICGMSKNPITYRGSRKL